jgi:glycosyltransferase involved in cell wall biosynthesis
MDCKGILPSGTLIAFDTYIQAAVNKHTLQRQPFRYALIGNRASTNITFRGPLLREMASRGIKVFALAPDYDDESRAAIESLGAIPVDCSLSRTGMNPVRDILDVFRLVVQFRRMALDGTLAYFVKPVIYGTLAARLAGVPHRFAMIEGVGYVFTDQEKPAKRRRLLRMVTSWLYRVSLGQADAVFMLNPDDRKLFVDERMVSAEKVQLLDGIGVELDHYQVAKPAVHPVSFILVGRLLREKGIYDYIEAARRVKAFHPEVRFLLIGSVDENPGSLAESEVHSWVAEGLIEWPGQVSDVRPWIAQASVFVLPSYREGLPRSTQEAMAMGRPVITTDASGCRETVEQGVNGFLVPVRSPDALMQAMLTFVEHPELIASMGVASRRIAETKFDVDKINAEILSSMGIVVKQNAGIQLPETNLS